MNSARLRNVAGAEPEISRPAQNQGEWAVACDTGLYLEKAAQWERLSP